jgi:hypothetical protein
MEFNLKTPAGVQALREYMMAERLRIMEELGLTKSPAIVLPAVRRKTRSRSSSGTRRREMSAAAAEEQKEAINRGLLRQRLHPNVRLLQEAGLPIPNRSRVGAPRVKFEKPGRRTSKRRF